MADDGTGGSGSPTDGGQLQAHTVRLELVDEPGELLRALKPIAEHGGNLLSIFHERGNITPRGHIPVEIDLECPPGRLETIVDALREEGVTVIQTDQERYGETVAVVLIGQLIETDLSDTISRIGNTDGVSVKDISLSAPGGTDDVASAWIRLGAASGTAESALETVQEVAADKDLELIEPLVEGG